MLPHPSLGGVAQPAPCPPPAPPEDERPPQVSSFGALGIKLKGSPVSLWWGGGRAGARDPVRRLLGIVGAIAEGRQLFTNLRLSFAYLLMLHAPLVATAALIPLMGYPLLYLPIHIIWIELILHPTALLVFQNLPSQGALSRHG